MMPGAWITWDSALVAVQLAEHVGFRGIGLYPHLATEVQGCIRQSPNADNVGRNPGKR